jgi:uncharacterized integral membrane protein (TIGR00698 family)
MTKSAVAVARGGSASRPLTSATALAVLPGVALCVAVMLAALPLADWLGGRLLGPTGAGGAPRASPISGVPVAIVLGLLIRNVVGLPAWLAPGVRFTVARILRLGIICVGVKLTLLDVARLGAWGLPIVALVVAVGLLSLMQLSRVCGLTPRLGVLLAAGTSICGVTAVVSTAAAIKAEERESAYAVATVTLFGLLAMLTYPHIAPLLLPTPEQIGVFLGVAVHDTSQVVGAALTYQQLHGDDTALKAAATVKLTRNLFLVLVVPLLTLWHARGSGAVAGRTPVMQLLPLFIFGFLALALLRTAGDYTAQRGLALGALEPATWKHWTTQVGDVWGARYLLGAAMAAVGLSTSLPTFRSVGLRPLAVGLAGALLVGATGLGLALTLAANLRL